jgi:hypothetical protein
MRASIRSLRFLILIAKAWRIHGPTDRFVFVLFIEICWPLARRPFLEERRLTSSRAGYPRILGRLFGLDAGQQRQ